MSGAITYSEYIRSPEWRAKRDRYWASGLGSDCYVCGAQRHPGMHLHHRTYKNLGNERLMDLVPLCQPCHAEVHEFDRTNPSARRKGLWWATKQTRKRRRRHLP